MFVMFNRLAEKKPQFQKIRKLHNLFHFNKQGISCIESLDVSNLDASPKCCKRNSLSYWHMNLWAAELGKYYSNVYRKLSLAPLNILSSVYCTCVYLTMKAGIKMRIKGC